MVRVLLLIFLIVFLSSINSFAEDDFWESYTTDNSGLASNSISCIAIDENGVKWFGHDDGAGISVFDGNTWEILKPCEQEYLYVEDILFDEGYVWAATNYGLYRYNGLTWDVVPVTEQFYIQHRLKGPDGSLWMGGSLSPDGFRDTISRLKDGEQTTWFHKRLGGMVFDHDGRLWVGGTGAVYCYDGLMWIMYESDSFKYITKIVVDTNGTLWFVSFEFDNPVLLSYNFQDWSKYSLFNVFDMTFNDNSTFWGIFYNNLITIDSSEVRRYDLEGIGEWNISNLIAFDTDGTLWLAGGEGLIWGNGVAHISLNNLDPPVEHLAIEDAVQTIDVTTAPQPGDGLYNPEDPFPLSVGNTWVYRREFRPYDGYWEPVFEDRTVLTIIDTVTVNDILYYRFLDGRLLGKDENGNIFYESGSLMFDFSPCSDTTCVDGIYLYNPPSYYKTRIEATVSIGSETYSGYRFSFSDGLHGEAFKTAPGIGITTWRQITDSGFIDNLYLEYACINGVEIGSTTVAVTDKVPVPFALSVPYPNPFNFQTTIEFILPEQTPIQLVIYSITGQKVRTLISGNLPPGRHAIRWDGTDMQGTTVASGVYIVRLSAFGKSITRPMAFVK